jgi:DNA-directed RNA polymerase specialized sigma24 family protein
MDERLARIRDKARSDTGEAASLADALTADLAPVIRSIAERQCRAIRRPDLAADAVQNALVDVMRELRGGAERNSPRTYLRVITCNAVSRTVTAHGGLYPTAAQRRRASIAAAAARFLAATGRPASDTELLRAQHDLISGRADAKDQAATATLEEVRAFLAGEERFTEDEECRTAGAGDGKKMVSAESRIPRQPDHVDEDLALGPLDAQRLIRLTAAAFPPPRPWVDGAKFATSVLTRTMTGMFSLHALAHDCGLSRSVARTAVANVWRTAARVAREDIGITSVRVS